MNVGIGCIACDQRASDQAAAGRSGSNHFSQSLLLHVKEIGETFLLNDQRETPHVADGNDLRIRRQAWG
jgi:hypothetical protein